MIGKTKILSILVVAVAASVIGTAYAEFDKIQETERIPEPVNENARVSDVTNFEPFSSNEINSFRNIAEVNHEVMAKLGENYEFQNIQYAMENPIVVFELVYSTENSKINVIFENGKVVDVIKYDRPDKWGLTNGLVIKSYNSTTDLKGIAHEFATPSSYSSSESTAEVLLANGMKEGSDDTNICDSSNSPTDYWGQAGVQFDTNGMRGGWADTDSDCVPTFFGSLSISAGDEIVARVYLDDSVSNKWWMTVDNLDDAYAPYGKTRTITGSSELEKDNRHTSIWWESHHTPNQGWDSDFGSDLVSDWASYKDTGNNNWYLWGDENEDTALCSPTANPTSVVSGVFDSSPNDVTWDVSDIEDDCGRGNH